MPGDDCVAIIGGRGGSSDINITRVACGPGHGIRFVDIKVYRDFNSSVFEYMHDITITFPRLGYSMCIHDKT